MLAEAKDRAGSRVQFGITFLQVLGAAQQLAMTDMNTIKIAEANDICLGNWHG